MLIVRKMSCILCLKSGEQLLSKAMLLFSEEAINLNVKSILMQHFWVQPNEHDIYNIICKECWNYLIEFHEFYVRIQRAHQSLKNLESSIFCKLDTPKVEPQDCLFETTVHSVSLSELDQGDVLEEYPIDTTDGGLSDDALSYPLEENNKKDAMKNVKKSDVGLPKAKTRRGRPPKVRGIKTKEEEISIIEKTQDVLPHESTDLEFSAEKEEFSLTKKRNNSKEVMTKKLISRRNLSQYDSFISENIKLICAVCSEDCDNFTTLQSHFRSAHQMRGYVLCCGKKLLKRGVLVDHLYTHKDPEYFKCTKCSKVLADRRCLKLHQLTHQEKGEPTFKCEICLKGFHLHPVYRRHVASHTPQELRKFECTHCAKRYASKYLLNNHVRLVHLNKYSRVCDICGKKVIGSEAFRVHQEQHKGLQKELINCDICGATAKTKYGLTRHKKVKHTKEYQTPQQCKYCSKISPNMIALSRHVNYMHSLQRNHKCSMCEKSFKRSKDLKEHFSTHTGDVLYFCTFCPRTFNSNANMYAHRKKKHHTEWAQNRKEKPTKPITSLKDKLTTLLESK